MAKQHPWRLSINLDNLQSQIQILWPRMQMSTPNIFTLSTKMAPLWVRKRLQPWVWRLGWPGRSFTWKEWHWQHLARWPRLHGSFIGTLWQPYPNSISSCSVNMGNGNCRNGQLTPILLGCSAVESEAQTQNWRPRFWTTQISSKWVWTMMESVARVIPHRTTTTLPQNLGKPLFSL